MERYDTNRFDRLLEAMTRGEAPSAQKKPSDGQASDAEHDKEPVAHACASAVKGCSSGRVDLRAAMLTSV
jgi:hypothetical protein